MLPEKVACLGAGKVISLKTYNVWKFMHVSRESRLLAARKAVVLKILNARKFRLICATYFIHLPLKYL